MQGVDDVRAPSSSCIEMNSVVAAQRLDHDQSCRRQRVGGLPDQFGETVVGGVERRESCNGATPIGDATRSIRP